MVPIGQGVLNEILKDWFKIGQNSIDRRQGVEAYSCLDLINFRFQLLQNRLNYGVKVDERARNSRNIDIITFDELFERAYHIVFEKKIDKNKNWWGNYIVAIELVNDLKLIKLNLNCILGIEQLDF